MSEERSSKEGTKGLRALTPPCPRLQAKRLQPLPTFTKEAFSRPSASLQTLECIKGGKQLRRVDGRNVWSRAMTVGSGGASLASLAAALLGCTKQVSQRPGRPRVNKLTWLGGPSLLLLMVTAGKRSWHSKGFSLQNIRSSQSFVLEVEVEGYLVGW